MEIKPEDIWNKDKLKRVSEFIKTHSKNQSEEQKLRTKQLGEQYKKEDENEK